MRIGYARVSSKHQNLGRQITALEDHGCDEILARPPAIGHNSNEPSRVSARTMCSWSPNGTAPLAR
jgi:hypothetical protein